MNTQATPASLPRFQHVLPAGQPCEIKAGKHNGFVGMFGTLFVQAPDGHVREDGQARVCRRPPVKRFCDRPGPALIIAEPDGHINAGGIRRIGEEYAVAPLPVGTGITDDARLTDRFDEGAYRRR